MGCFALLSGMVFLIPVTEQGDRLDVTLNLILTAAAYKYAISTMTPPVPYLTLLEKVRKPRSDVHGGSRRDFGPCGRCHSALLTCEI